jgi:hypothetical protein
MDDHPSIVWSNALEKLIAEEGERCAGLSQLHAMAERKYNKYNNLIQIPVLIFSTISGTASIGSQTLFGDNPMSSVGIGLLSIITAIISSLGTFFAFAKRNEGHRISCLQYHKLSKEISIELSLPRNERQKADILLKNIRAVIERLSEVSPAIDLSLIEQFNQKYKNMTAKKPEIANGIDKISVYIKDENPGHSEKEPGHNFEGGNDAVREEAYRQTTSEITT